MADRQFLEQLTKHLADEGKLIEAGWIGLRLAAGRLTGVRGIEFDPPATAPESERNVPVPRKPRKDTH